MQKLDYLRTQAEVFLRMLNDMRRRLKELPPDALAAKQYRCVLVYLHMMSSTVNTCIYHDSVASESHLISLIPRSWPSFPSIAVLGPGNEASLECGHMKA